MNEIEVGNVYLLTDAETDEAAEYEVVGVAEIEGRGYAAIVPYGEEVEEYVILRVESDEEGVIFSAIEDDDEWETAAVYFDNRIFGTVDHDEV